MSPVAELTNLQQRIVELEHQLAIAQAQAVEVPRLRLFEMIVERAADGMSIARADGVQIYANPAFRALSGLAHTLSLFDMHPPDVHAHIQAEVIPQLEQTGAWQDELPAQRPDGTRWQAQLRVFVVEGDDGPLWVTVLRDVTSQHDQVRALERSEQRFHDIVDSSNGWVWEVDAAGRYTYCSGRVRDILGHAPEAMLGTTPFDHMLPDEVQRVGAIFGQLVAARAPIVSLENRNRTHDGREVVLLTSGQPILGEDGALLGYRGIDIDITQEREREREREQLREQVIAAQQATLRELSTPLIPLADGVVAMPLVGSIDSGRAQQIIEALLQGVAAARAQTVLIDITGVAVVDTQVANALLRAAQAVKLLGAQVVLTGIRPEVAQTLVGLGVDLGGIVTRSTLQLGVAEALNSGMGRQRDTLAGR